MPHLPALLLAALLLAAPWPWRASSALGPLPSAAAGATSPPSSPIFELTPSSLQPVAATIPSVELEDVGHAIYGGMYSQLVFDESFEDPRDAWGSSSSGGGSVVSFNASGNPDLVLRHCNAVLWASAPTAPLDDHRFRIQPPLATPALSSSAPGSSAPNTSTQPCSLESVNFPGWFVAPVPDSNPPRMGIVRRGGNATAAFDESATFFLRRTTAGSMGRVQATLSQAFAPFRFIAPTSSLSKQCVFPPPAFDVGLASAPYPWILTDLVQPRHWRFAGPANTTTQAPFHGNVSVVMAEGASASNAGLYERGMAVSPGRDLHGYFFARVSSPNRLPWVSRPSGLPAKLRVSLVCLNDSESTPLAVATFSVDVGQWTQFFLNFTLPNSSLPCALARLTLEYAAGSTPLAPPDTAPLLHLDMVFLEPGPAFRFEGQHLRRDVVDALLLDGGLRAIRLDGTSVCANKNYVWRNMRGPAWLRPPRADGFWYRFMSNGFGMFEFLALAEAAGLEAYLGINIWAETPESAAALAEYIFGNTSTANGALRAKDGHPAPYSVPRLIVELGNEESSSAYPAAALPILDSMRTRLEAVAPDVLAAGRVHFAIAYAPDFARADPQAVQQLLTATRNISDLLIWDQHAGADSLNDPAAAFAVYDTMLQTLRQGGWTQPLPVFIGETNCNVSPGVCKSMQRALVYGRFAVLSALRGYIAALGPAVWAYSTCSGQVCGATDGASDWPQEDMILLPDSVIFQPPYFARKMLAKVWNANLVNGSGSIIHDSDGGTLDLLALAPPTGGHPGDEAYDVGVFVVNAAASATNVTVVLNGSTFCGGKTTMQVLSSVDLGVYNTLSAPNTIAPTAVAVDVASSSSTLGLALPGNTVAALTLCVADNM